MNLITWLNKQGYECIENVRLGGKIPDVLALKHETVAFELKRKADEVPKALGQSLHYLNEANKVYIVLPKTETKYLSSHSLDTLKKYGVGLIAVNDTPKIICEAKNFEVLKKKSIFDLIKGKEIKEVKKNLRNRIIKTLRKYPEGLTILSLSKILKMNRITVTKYVYGLEGSGIISHRKIGTAKLCFLAKKGEKREGWLI